MITRESLKKIVVEALKANDGRAYVADVCKYIWDNYESELKNSGRILYTWQYDVRWAAQKLRDNGTLKPVYGNRKKPWELA
jgi:hypothetical protein